MNRQTASLAQKIAAEQQADGSFASLAVPEGADTGVMGRVRATTFFTSLVAGALAGAELPELQPVRERAVDFLLRERGPQWSFNYWARRAPEVGVLPYPDDWDDTACALAAIQRVRPEALGGEALADMVTMLTETEIAEGGPYRTWLVGSNTDPVWQDVDLAVNCNIAYMLSLQGVELPSLVELADRAIGSGEFGSPYYPTAFPAVYFLSRWYGGGRARQVIDWLFERLQNGWWGNPMNTALAVTAALNLGAEPEELAAAAENLTRLPADSLVRPYPFCYDPAENGQHFVAGAGALTAALVLEALHKYEAARAARPAAQITGDDEARRLHARVVDRCRARFERAGGGLREAGLQVMGRVLAGDPASQVTLLPHLLRRALGRRGRTIGDERLVQLGALSLMGWTAYTIYDDFLDGEGKAELLPLANLALREVAVGYAQDQAGPEFAGLAKWVLDRMEAANAWEVQHCRVADQHELLTVPPPDYGDLSRLADRSLGHALGALAIMAQTGYAPISEEAQAVVRFFRHFLIARQLNDEAHDWKPDLQHGHINAVGARLLAAETSRGDNVDGLYDRLEQAFWEREIVTVCERTLRELGLAREALRRTGLEQPEVLEALLAPVESAARQAIAQQRQTLEFLRAYRPPKP